MRRLYIIILSLFLFSNLQAQNGWVRYYTGYNFALTDVFFVNNSTGWAVGDQYILKSENGGVNWQRQADTNTLPQNLTFKKIFFLNSTTGWAVGGGSTTFPFCIDNRILLKTTNGGATWFGQPAPSADDNILYDVYATDENNVFVCDYGTEQFCIYSSGGIFKSSNSGNSWNYVSGPDNLYGFSRVSFINQNTGWAIGIKQGDTPPTFRNILKTTNAGNNWSIIRSDTNEFFGVTSIQFLNSLTGYLSAYKSTDGGITWFKPNSTLTDSLGKTYFVNPNTGWAIGNERKLMKRTTDGGITWVNQYSQGNLFFNLACVYFINELHGWVSSYNGYIYATGTGGVTSIQPISSEVPENFQLHQNYPNPFNPKTKIKFEIPLTVRGQRSEVRLSVYDVSGKEVRVLVNSELAPGVYEYSFDGTGLGSGVYFYRIAVHSDKLQTGNYSQTRRMVLVK